MPNHEKALPLFIKHRAELLDYATGIVGQQRAEDVVQEAYLRFGKALGRRSLRRPVGYLFRIVRNLSLDFSRRAVFERELVNSETQVDEVTGEVPTPEEQALYKDELKTVMSALAELPAPARTALEMHRFGGFRLQDVATELGVSIGQAHALVSQALQHCRKKLNMANSAKFSIWALFFEDLKFLF